ncbi:MAG: hypothetical protein ACI4AQ_10245 [Lachnospiraceae bacterium]
MLQGVFRAVKKDHTEYYRASITYRNKHVSLGSFDTEKQAGKAYREARKLLDGRKHIKDYKTSMQLDFEKWVILVNFRDNAMYIKTPIYLRKQYFEYYLSQDVILKFDVDDLFYYSNHKIMTRNGYMFVADYGMQVNILSRYGIKNHAVEGRDFIFANGDVHDYRYGNVVIVNKYHGVIRIDRKGRYVYKVKIHIRGDYVVGVYDNEITAAIAYNKAADLVREAGILKDFPENYIEDLSAIEYAAIYNKVSISKNLRKFASKG